jgi:Na+-translocating ferredoxin:NAD+ oxidoreductase subunit B
MSDVYQGLREHLDKLPAGYPSTENGVEIRILEQLFTPEEAQMAQQLGLKLETAEVIAERTGMPLEQTAELLQTMARKGLIFSIETEGRPPAYMASQFVVGIWEYHVDRLTPQFIKDTDEYFPTLVKEAFDHLPQLRTIPVGKSIEADTKILAYEKAEELVRQQKKILVAPCICRKEQQLKGEGCGKPQEVCLIFGWGADYYERNGLGRIIGLEETLDILRRAEEEGLVLQPSNTQDVTNICCCCGDCCLSLRNLKTYPAPAEICSTPFVVQAEVDDCEGCETCLDRCQMDALSMLEDVVAVAAERCIGCGLCVSTCPTEALKLVRKPDYKDDEVPANTMEAMQRRAQARAAARRDLESKFERHKRI